MKKIALATCQKLSELTPDDRALALRLQELRMDARPLVWNNQQQQLEDVAAVLEPIRALGHSPLGQPYFPG